MAEGQFPDPVPQDFETFQPQDAIGKGIKGATYLGAAGFFISAVQNSVSKQNVGSMGIFTRSGTSIALFAAMGGAYTFTEAATSNLRQSNDHWSKAVGGFASGAVGGLYKRTFPAVMGNGLALAVIMGVAGYTKANMFGAPDIHPDEGRWPTKEDLRKRFSRPDNETINELGEGRGIYGPDYQERRRQRIKDNHGIDVPKPFWEEKPESQPMR